MRQYIRAHFDMLTGVESSILVTQIPPKSPGLSIPHGGHVEAYALQGYPFDSELKPSVTMSARPVSLLPGEGAFLVPLYAGRCPFEKRWCHPT